MFMMLSTDLVRARSLSTRISSSGKSPVWELCKPQSHCTACRDCTEVSATAAGCHVTQQLTVT